jgi:hypothetical protein
MVLSFLLPSVAATSGLPLWETDQLEALTGKGAMTAVNALTGQTAFIDHNQTAALHGVAEFQPTAMKRTVWHDA